MESVHVIVGAGQAGNWAAVGMRQAGFAGRVVLIGEEPWHPYERPPLSKAVLTEVDEPPAPFFLTPTAYSEQSIDIMLSTKAVGIDAPNRQLSLDNGENLAFDKLLIATGGRARRLAIPGGEHAYYLRNLDDARRLRGALASASRVVCIGAGVVGLEVAASARARGASVTVLEAGSSPMGRSLSPEGATEIDKLHRNAGVEVRYGVNVDAIVSEADGFHVICADGSDFSCDLVVAAVGMERNVELAAEAGINHDRGILVDEFGRSSIEDIYAAGDVTAFHHPLYQQPVRLEAWSHAQNHGLAVGKSMSGELQAYEDIPWFWSDQHGANIQLVGQASEADQTITRVNEATKSFTAVHLAKNGRVLGVMTINNPTDIRAGRSLIRSRQPVDVGLVRDPSVPLAKTKV